MGRAMETILANATAPTGTLAAATAASGSTFTVRSYPAPNRAFIIDAWAMHQTAGEFRIRSVRMHDGAQSLRMSDPAASPQSLFPKGGIAPVESQDTLVVELSGSVVAGDIEQGLYTIYYENLQGVEAKLIDYATFMSRAKHPVHVPNTISTGTAGGWSGEEAINAEVDVLKAGKEYALAGCLVATNPAAAIGYRSSDWGNFRLGVPGNTTLRHLGSNYFIDLARRTNAPCIPVVSGSNKGSLLVDAAVDENGADPTVNTCFFELD